MLRGYYGELYRHAKEKIGPDPRLPENVTSDECLGSG